MKTLSDIQEEASTPEAWEKGPVWDKIVAHPCLDYPLEPRHAKAVLELAGQLVAQGVPISKVLTHLERLKSRSYNKLTTRIAILEWLEDHEGMKISEMKLYVPFTETALRTTASRMVQEGVLIRKGGGIYGRA